VVIPLTWFAARPFKDGKSQVADDDDWFTINKDGNVIG